MSTDTINSVTQLLTSVFEATDEVLTEYKGESNLQFPDLIGMLAVKLNWNEKQMRENDPLVRYYVRQHPEWYVTRGAHGGIMRISDKQKKEAAKSAKASVKKQLSDQLNAKVAAASSVVSQTVSVSAPPTMMLNDDDDDDSDLDLD